MDLNDIQLTESAETGADLQLLHPVTDEPIGAVFTLAGSDSETFRRKSKEQVNKRMAKMVRGKNKDFSVSEDEECELLAACTLGWKDLIMGGEKVKFSADEAKKIYKKFPWIREQVNEFIGDRANFFTMP